MKEFEDLTGKTFGQLFVLGFGDNYIFPSGTKKVRWKVLCSCNRSEVFLVFGGNLKKNSSTCCMMCKNEKISKRRFRDITGKRFGQLTVHSLDFIDSRKGAKWLCLCNCGRNDYVSVWRGNLISGQTTSCTACQHIRAGKATLVDITGKTFGILRVIKLTNITKYGSHWLCKCECGNEKEILASNLKAGNTKSCGCLKESLIAHQLKKYFKKNYDSINEYNVIKNPKTNQWLKCDIYLPKDNVFIEIHGSQHYTFNSFNRTQEEFESQIERDNFKKDYYTENGKYIEINLLKINTSEEAICNILEFLSGNEVYGGGA